MRGASLRILHPDFDEPFSADSQGQKFLDEKKPMPAREMRDAVILKVALR